MKKLINIASIISIALTAAFAGLISNGENVLAYEYEQSKTKVLVWICLGASILYPLIAHKINFSRNENLGIFLAVLTWGILLVLAFLFAGYFSTEFNNPYL